MSTPSELIEPFFAAANGRAGRGALPHVPVP